MCQYFRWKSLTMKNDEKMIKKWFKMVKNEQKKIIKVYNVDKNDQPVTEED